MRRTAEALQRRGEGESGRIGEGETGRGGAKNLEPSTLNRDP